MCTEVGVQCRPLDCWWHRDGGFQPVTFRTAERMCTEFVWERNLLKRQEYCKRLWLFLLL
jgi:hypothetical protein